MHLSYFVPICTTIAVCLHQSHLQIWAGLLLLLSLLCISQHHWLLPLWSTSRLSVPYYYYYSYIHTAGNAMNWPPQHCHNKQQVCWATWVRLFLLRTKTVFFGMLLLVHKNLLLSPPELEATKVGRREVSKLLENFTMMIVLVVISFLVLLLTFCYWWQY